MSFSVPQHIPDFSSTVREVENRLWAAKGKGSTELPLYKDKPYGVDYMHNKKTKKKRKILLLFTLATSVFFLLYKYGGAAGSADSSSESSGFSSLFPFSRNKNKDKALWNERRDSVKDAFVRSWEGYEKYAWGKDIYKPVSKTGANMGPKPLGWIIVDSLDTLKIMGLNSQLSKARSWVKNELKYDIDYNASTFETTIRMLGGLLSAHFLTHDDVYLDQATDLANRLVAAFDSPTGIPYASVNLHTGVGVKSHTETGASSLAEIATLQLEFKYLARLTGEPLYWQKVEQVMAAIDNNRVADGLGPTYIHPDTGKFEESVISLGARGDSYYEYLIKQYLQTTSHESVYKSMYDEAILGVKKRLIGHSEPNKLTYIGEIEPKTSKLLPRMDHLVCFAGGMLALGATEGVHIDTARRTKWTVAQEDDFRLGMELAHTCFELYNQTASGLAPETVYFHDEPGTYISDFSVKQHDAHNLQRPETVESLFVLWRLTKNPIYREWGWMIFQAFEKHTRVEGDGGYSAVDDVTEENPIFRDNMESFWLSETLKYLYLLFDDDEHELSLSDVVFNTEGHPFPKFGMGSVFKTGWQRNSPSEAGKPFHKKEDPLQPESVKKTVIADSKKIAATTEYVVVATPNPELKNEKKEQQEKAVAKDRPDANFGTGARTEIGAGTKENDGRVAEAAAEAAKAAANKAKAQGSKDDSE